MASKAQTPAPAGRMTAGRNVTFWVEGDVLYTACRLTENFGRSGTPDKPGKNDIVASSGGYVTVPHTGQRKRFTLVAIVDPE